jgi:deazaflavin-dependent oxidoreductase (nitroreductase family)
MRSSGYDFERAGRVRRVVRLLVTFRPVAAVSARVLPSLDRVGFRLSRGRVTPSAWVTGLPVLQLTTRGARSGEPRSVRVLGVPDGDALLVVAANFGAGRHPAWYHNLRRHPDVVVENHGVRRPFRAELLEGEERERGFARAVTLNPGWRRFRAAAGDREIPVFRLTPRD